MGLKYTGKKIPFSFDNPRLISGKMYWEKRGDVIQVPFQDAQVLTLGSGNDFQIVYPDYVEPEPAPPPVDEEDHKEEQPEEEAAEQGPEDEILDPLFADEEQPRRRGRPRKDS